MEMREAEMKALFLRSSLEHSVVGRQINSSPGEMIDIVRAAMGVKWPSTVLPSKLDACIHEVAHSRALE